MQTTIAKDTIDRVYVPLAKVKNGSIYLLFLIFLLLPLVNPRSLTFQPKQIILEQIFLVKIYQQLMKNFPSWIPNFNAWMSAILLLLLVRGMKYMLRILVNQTDYRFFKMLSLNSHAILYLLILLSPIVVIAITHHLLHISLDLFFPDTQTPEMTGRKYWFPGLMGWWEGLYGWLAIALTMIISTVIGIIIFSPSYYWSQMSDWWLGMKNFFNPLMLIRLVCVAYLYQFEYLVRQHLMAVGTKNQ